MCCVTTPCMNCSNNQSHSSSLLRFKKSDHTSIAMRDALLWLRIGDRIELKPATNLRIFPCQEKTKTVTGPSAWNNLPVAIQGTKTLSAIKKVETSPPT